ncbi:MAG: hypothetical protein K6E49_09585 [Lachnospiraceae bacterium]|nr:hypothetical protein [Lachnospiraceae bacterium]
MTLEQNRQFYECFLDAYFGDRLTAYARELLDDVTAFLTRCIRIGVPFAEGRGDRNAFKELLTTDPGTMRGRFSELDSLIFS